LWLLRDEDAAFRQSSTAQRRQELEKRASEKAEAEDARIREEAAAARRQEKEAKIEELRTINLQVSCPAGPSSAMIKSACVHRRSLVL
jgi:hypothetical protein